MVTGDVEVLKIREIQTRNGTREPVCFKFKSQKMSQTVDCQRNLTREVVKGEIEAVKSKQGVYGVGKLAVKIVV